MALRRSARRVRRLWLRHRQARLLCGSLRAECGKEVLELRQLQLVAQLRQLANSPDQIQSPFALGEFALIRYWVMRNE